MRHVVMGICIGALLLAGTRNAGAQSADEEKAPASLNLRDALRRVEFVGGQTVSPGKALPPPQLKSTHRFFDACNLASTAAETAALLADGYYTQYGLTRYPDRFVEVDPMAKPFVSNGWGGQILGGALVIGADLGIRYLLHRTNHHRVERWIPLVLITYGTMGAINNATLIHKAER